MEHKNTNIRSTLVLYSLPLRGHLVSMVELAKLIIDHYPDDFRVIVLMPCSSSSVETVNAATTSYISAAAASLPPQISFHHLPPPTANISSAASLTNLIIPTLSYELPLRSNPQLQEFLSTTSKTTSIKAFIIDFFCNAAFPVSTSFNIPTYYYFTSSTNTLLIFLHLPTLHNKYTKSLVELGKQELLDIPGMQPLPASDVPQGMEDRSDRIYDYILETSKNMIRSSGFIANSCDSLECRAINAIRDGLCVPDAPTPPIYPIGPLIETKINSTSNNRDKKHECLRWLDEQPSGTVVFLCFGSMGTFSQPQLREIAEGLERTDIRFLWVVRAPPPESEQGKLTAPKDDDSISVMTETFLPEGFLERMRERAMVVRSWAPQLEVLSHGSVGGFVTHCGWNSVVEAVWCGVPMVTWPLYAEQKVNRAFLVREIGVGLDLEVGEDGMVSSGEVQRRIRELMVEEKGMKVRERMMAVRDAVAAAAANDGSSLAHLAELVELFRSN